VEVEEALRALGGTARWSQLQGHGSWRALERARSSATVIHENGAWTLAGTPRARVVAQQLRAVRSHTSAAEHWGLALPAHSLDLVTVTVPRRAHRDAPDDVRLRYRDLPAADRDGDVTTPRRTVVDCLRDESLRVALCVGDSALRSGVVEHRRLATAVGALRGPGSRQARARVDLLDARADNAFESCCRAILVEAGIEGFEPQVTIRHRGQWIGRVDLADRRRRIVIECDGFETHGGRGAFVRDLVRFTSLVAAGWRPLRFTWEQVMFSPDWVTARVLETTGGALLEDQRARKRRRIAA
jgi:very-short-patch-repair endonuclease